MRSAALLCLLVTSSAGAGQAAFRDASVESGTAGTGGQARGVAVCDYNGDGLPDIFVCNLDGPNYLYRNEGNAVFTEVGSSTPLATTGSSMTSLWADLDNDGDQEVFIGNKDEPSRLFQAGPEGTFRDVTARAGIYLTARVQSGVVFDYDGDGMLDLYLTVLGGANRLYRNLGDLRFEEVSCAGGGSPPECTLGDDLPRLAMGALTLDYDLDGDQDLYLVHDGSQPNVLLRNEGGYFTDVSAESGAGLVGEGMGVDAADYDGDGDFDLYVTNLYENFLLRNEGNGTFREVGYDARVNDLGMGWGTAFLDYDNDGRPDLYVANETGFTIGGERYNNVLYHNQSDHFATGAAPTAAINSDRSAYGAAVADFNADGLTDVFIGNDGQQDQLFLNTTPSTGHWIALRLRGRSGNRDAIGARVQVYVGDEAAMAEVRTGGSFASQHDRMLHFGLGDYEVVDSVVVHWPLGAAQSLTIPEVDRSYTLIEGQQATVTTALRRSPRVHALGIYPNPTRERLYLSKRLRNVRLLHVSGREVLRLVGPTATIRLPGDLAAGTYVLEGYSREGHYRARVVKQ